MAFLSVINGQSRRVRRCLLSFERLLLAIGVLTQFQVSHIFRMTRQFPDCRHDGGEFRCLGPLSRNVYSLGVDDLTTVVSKKCVPMLGGRACMLGDGADWKHFDAFDHSPHLLRYWKLIHGSGDADSFDTKAGGKDSQQSQKEASHLDKVGVG